MYRTLLGLVASLVAAVSLAAVSFTATSGGPADVRFLNGTEPKSLDPHVLTGQPEGRLALALFEGLTQYDPQTLGPAPAVAKSWDLSEDGTTYTFHLRQDSLWSDGVALTAADFVYSLRRLLDPAMGSEYAYLLYPIRGAEALNTFAARAATIDTLLVRLRSLAAKGEDLPASQWRELLAELPLNDSLKFCPTPVVRKLLDSPPSDVTAEELSSFVAALPLEAARLRSELQEVQSRFGVSLGVFPQNPYTLTVQLEAPTPYFLSITSFYTALPVPRHVVERVGTGWFLPDTLVGNGPFTIENWRVNDRIRLRKSPTYWDKASIRSNVIEAIATENATTALNLYLTGELDWLPSFYPTDLVHELRQRPDFYATPGFSVYYFRLNNERPPLNDKRVRHALNLAIDRKVIVEEVLGLGQIPAGHFVPPGVPGYEPPPSSIELNVDKARDLLAQAGYPDGRGFPKIGILYNTSEGHKKIAEVVASQLKQHLGIEVEPYNQEWQSFLATSRSGNYHIGRAGWIGDYLDPNTFLDLWQTNGGNNQTGFSSATYDALLRAASDIYSFAEAPGTLLARLKYPERVEQLLEKAKGLSGAAKNDALQAIRMALLAEAEAILIQDEFPVIPVYFYVNSGLKAPDLKGLHLELTFPDGTTMPNLQQIHPIQALYREQN